MRKLKGDGGQQSCPNCGGIHFGTRFDNCPFIKAPCEICGTPTIYACSDCKIDTGVSVHVCEKTFCQTQHDKKFGSPSHCLKVFIPEFGPVCDGSHEAEHVGKPTHRDKVGNLRCECGYILELAKSCDVRSNLVVPDSPEYLARWIWQNYVGIPGADLPPYDAEFTRLLDRIKNLGKLCECGHNHGISIHRYCADTECKCDEFRPSTVK